MNAIAKFLRGDQTRPTRLHTANGYLCIRPIEFFRALATTSRRLLLGQYPRLPWLAYSVISYIEPLAAQKRVFEFGSGMSTLWFSDRSREVVSVDSSREWYDRGVKGTANRRNVTLFYATTQREYLDSISRAGGKFDLVLIDGMYRPECVKIVRSWLNPGGVVVVDNTDADDDLSRAIDEEFSDSHIRKFHGLPPGTLHPNETAVIEMIPLAQRG